MPYGYSGGCSHSSHYEDDQTLSYAVRLGMALLVRAPAPRQLRTVLDGVARQSLATKLAHCASPRGASSLLPHPLNVRASPVGPATPVLGVGTALLHLRVSISGKTREGCPWNRP